MARIKGISSNLNAFLDMLALSEGTSTSPITKNDGYDVIVTGLDGNPEIFTDYRWHPFSLSRRSKIINSKGLTSNASGRYQFMLKDYKYYRDLLKLPNFGPESQDTWAIRLIKERGALPLIEAGKFDEAVAKVSNLWASLPGAGYGQPEHALSALRVVYTLKGGKLWESKPSLLQSLPQLPEYSEPINTVPQKLETRPMQIIEIDKPQSMLKELSNLMKKLFKHN